MTGRPLARGQRVWQAHGRPEEQEERGDKRHIECYGKRHTYRLQVVAFARVATFAIQDWIGLRPS